MNVSMRPWLTNAALLVIGCGLTSLTLQLVREFDHYTIGFSGVSGWSLILYGAAVLVILTQPVNRSTFAIILGVGILCRLIPLFPRPYLSTDIYRYAWDGVVQHAHISPYRYVPGDQALAFLRSHNHNLFDHINRRDYAHTIYPPAAQFLFYLITFISPTVTFTKLVMVLFEGLTLYALLELLQEMGMRREQALLYAWCPLLIWEFGSSGHLDSAAIAFIALALLARYRQQPIATGIFLGLAFLIKLYPIILFPALFRRGEYKMPAVVAGLALFSYGCYASVGLGVFGFLGGYVQEEGLGTGNRYFLLEQCRHIPGLQALPTSVFFVFCAIVLAATVSWCWTTCCRTPVEPTHSSATRFFDLPPQADFLAPAFLLSFIFMLLFSPHYPWYVAWLVPFFTLIPALTAFTYIGAIFYLLSTALAVGLGPKQLRLNQILYSTVILAFIVEVLMRKMRLQYSVSAGSTSKSERLDQGTKQ